MVFRIVITSLRPYDHYVCRDPWRACRRGHPGWCTKHRPQPSRSLRPRWLSRGCRGGGTGTRNCGSYGDQMISRTDPMIRVFFHRVIFDFPVFP